MAISSVTRIQAIPIIVLLNARSREGQKNNVLLVLFKFLPSLHKVPHGEFSR